MLKTIKHIIKLYEPICLSLKRERARLPAGTVYKRMRDGNPTYVQVLGNRQHGVTRDNKTLSGLLRKQYVDALILEYERILSLLGAILEDPVVQKAEQAKAALLSNHPLADNTVIRHGKQLINWATTYPVNTYPNTGPEYITNGGVRVRSKSEMLIGNMLESMGILYRYDCAIDFWDGIVCPDFMIKLPDGEVIIWEHMGLWDDPVRGPEYINKKLRQLEIYRANGYSPGLNLIYTFEEDVADPERLRAIITKALQMTGYRVPQSDAD